MAGIDAVIFDMDGLLVDTEQLAADAMDAFLLRYGLDRRQDIHDQMLGRRLVDAIEIVRLGYALDDPLEDLTLIYAEMRRQALVGKVHPMPGALEIVTFVRDAGLAVGLASSGIRDHVDLSLHEAGLAGLFGVEVTGDEVERGKPAPDLFLKAAEGLGVRPVGCVVFEDAPAGIEAAVAAGMRAICVPNEHSRDKPFSIAPELRLASLHEGVQWLQRQGVNALSQPNHTADSIRPRRRA